MDLAALWNFVQGLTPGAGLAPAEVQIALAPFSSRLVHLLKFKVILWMLISLRFARDSAGPL